MMKQRISVIIPTHNSEKYVERCLDSVVGQSYTNLDIIVVDDNSQDNTRKLVYDFQKKDNRIRIFEYSNSVGAFVARKRGILEAQGEYILFVDSDDYITVELCDELLGQMEEKIDILGFNAQVLNCGVSEVAYQEMCEFVAPYRSVLEGATVFEKCFIEGEYGFNLWNKLFSTKLCKRVERQLPDEPIYKANDLVMYFFLALSAKQYKGYASSNSYCYAYGNGSTGESIIGWSDFEAYLRYPRLLQYIIEVCETLGEYNDRISNAVDIIEKRLLNECVCVWKNRLSREMYAKGFDALAQAWKTVNITEGLWNLFRGKEIELAHMIAKSKGMQKNTRPIKTIAIFYFKMCKGGVERVVSLLIPMYLKMGYHVVLITDFPEDKDDFSIPSTVKRYVIPSMQQVLRTNRYKERTIALQNIFEREHVDAFCYQAASSPILLYDIVLTKLCGVKFVLSKHELFSQGMVRLENRLMKEVAIYPLVDNLVVLSQTEQKFGEALGIRTSYIPNPHMEFIASQYRNEGKNIVWVGRLDKFQKRYQDLIPIMNYVVEKDNDIKLKVYGSAECYWDVDWFQNEIRRNKLENNIEYCGYTTDLDVIYGNATVHLVTSAYETFGMNVFESQTYGIPLVTYDMPYLELQRAAKGCIVVEPRDYKGAAEAILRLVESPELRLHYSDSALQLVKQFQNSSVEEKWKEVFENCEEKEFEMDHDFAIILKTILFHYSLGYEYFELTNNSLQLFREKKWVGEICSRLVQKKLQPVIYPYGDMGRKMQKILHTYGINEAFIIDNKLADRVNGVKKLEDLSVEDRDKYLYLVCSNNKDLYDEIRTALYSHVEKEYVYDLYPRENA